MHSHASASTPLTFKPGRTHRFAPTAPKYADVYTARGHNLNFYVGNPNLFLAHLNFYVGGQQSIFRATAALFKIGANLMSTIPIIVADEVETKPKSG
jgi:hypothetical protein